MIPSNDDKLYQKMIEEIEDYAILMIDVDGIVVNWNKGAEKIKGYSHSEIIGKSFRNFYLPEDQEKQLPERLIQIAKTEGRATQEGWRVRKDGSRFWGSIVITAIHDEDYNVIGFTKVTRDLTERKKAEDQIQRYAKELEEQNKELQHFAYAAAHDMKEPVRKIMFYVNSVLESSLLPAALPEMRYLEMAAKASERMRILIDDILSYTRSSTASDPLKETDLNDVLAEVCLAHEIAVKETKAQIEASPLPRIKSIPFQIYQLFDNLLGNAIKYRHSNRAPHIKIAFEEVNADAAGIPGLLSGQRYNKISFTDNGIGFEAEMAEKIFEIFERLHGREQYPGNGIGLALCRRVVQNHGGTIIASGFPAEGARFDIYLPA